MTTVCQLQLGTDRVLELGQNGREPKVTERLSQLVFGDGAAQHNEPPQASCARAWMSTRAVAVYIAVIVTLTVSSPSLVLKGVRISVARGSRSLSLGSWTVSSSPRGG